MDYAQMATRALAVLAGTGVWMVLSVNVAALVAKVFIICKCKSDTANGIGGATLFMLAVFYGVAVSRLIWGWMGGA